MRAQLKPITVSIAPPETITMRQRRYLTELGEYVDGRKYITIKEFSTLTQCSYYTAGQKLKACRYISFGPQKQYLLADVAATMAKMEKCDI